MTTGKIRILIVGAKKFNVAGPLKRLSSVCEVTHYEQDSRELKKGEITASPDNIPHVILCFNDFIGHGESGKFRKKAALLNIPFAGASGGFGKLVEAAKKVDVDLSPFLISNRAPPKPEPEPKEGVEAWIDSLPRQAKERVVADGIRVWVMLNRGGGHSVILKGDVLRDAVDRVKKGKYGKGTRGSLTPKEAEHIVNALDSKYGFAKRGIGLSTVSVIRNVGFMLGTLPDAKMKSMLASTKKKGRKKKAAKKKTRPEMDEETKERQDRKAALAAEADLGDGDVVLSGDTIKDFMRETAMVMKGMLALNTKMDNLYDKIVDLETQNATYVEQATSLEAEKNRLEEELEAAKKEIAKWKKMVTTD